MTGALAAAISPTPLAQIVADVVPDQGPDSSLIIMAVVGGIVLLMIIGFVLIYNSLVGMRERVKEAWAQIDVQLKRRYDLIPNLVETAKGYKAHESETLKEVIEARNQAHTVLAQINEIAKNSGGIPAAQSQAQGPGLSPVGGSPMGMNLLAQAEGMLTNALNRFNVTVEQYPDLKADKHFSQLMEELSSTENKVAFSRQHYNSEVGRYNVKCRVIPNNIVAGMAGFKTAEFFELKDAGQREAPKVDFSS